ncbi:Gfo/Idh/MocA family oxidoreductase [Ruficoccus amylovorans]|uniref:Gfo/Idh/MocA family oxidoreductase n=1 Tax=Ruficoccus amylovorans TaxID=1804625 RepID=A0A842HGP9_9BACT|nr:Gfo/Idh/MocA family oxidoreductase [Ruficoccus amylovorans]MBC2595188.1 Gfo/Idh/MocA family oxidoreductase [Ruficoccus amylovorans]
MNKRKADEVKPVEVLIVGIGGYGMRYLEAVREYAHKGMARLVAVVDPCPENCPAWERIKAESVPHFSTLEDYLASGSRADLAAISSPIAFHAHQACLALEAGMNVLCEKPICATMDEARRMIAHRDSSGRFLEIGYQWVFSQAVQELKSDALAGLLGAPRRFLTRVAWPRGSAYYGRNNWAGAVRDAAGRVVYDSPVNNATAHHLHAMLYIAGLESSAAARPTAVTAECYRANKIENFDAACCRIETREGVEILFYSAHCVEEYSGPLMRYEYENAVVEFTMEGGMVARFGDGAVKAYGSPIDDPMRKMRHCIQRCRDGGKGAAVCPPEAAAAHTLCVEGIQHMPVQEFPPDEIREKETEPGNRLVYMPGLATAMEICFERGVLFSEFDQPPLTWTVRARRVEL